MSYFRENIIHFGDSPQLDGFGRLRTSQPHTVFDTSFVGQDNLQTYESITTGGGAATYLPHESAYELSCSTSSGDEVMRQSNRYFHYLPGKSHMVELTGAFLAPVQNAYKEIGYFDDEDGIFIRQKGTDGYELVLKTSTSGAPDETPIPQSSWNGDKLDGTGPSKKNVDLSNANIFAFDMQWLGVGRVRVYLNIGGTNIVIHEFDNAGNLTEVYMKTATLPIRYKMYNVGTTPVAPKMKQICSTVISEGGYNPSGRLVSQAVSTSRTVVNYEWRPLMSFRIKSNYANGEKVRGYAFMSNLNFLTTGQSSIMYRIIRNPDTLTGASFAQPNGCPISFMEIDTSATDVTPGNCYQMHTGYISEARWQDSQNFLQLKDAYDYANPSGTNGINTIMAISLNSSVDVFTSTTWREID